MIRNHWYYMYALLHILQNNHNLTLVAAVLPIQQKLLKFSGYTEEPLIMEPEPKRQKSLPPSNNLLRCLMLTPLPHTRQVYEGERIEIKIRLDVNPEPIIKWYKNEVELRPSHRITIDYYGGVACLTYNAVIASDTGHYRVHVVNAKGSVTSEMDFTVLPGQHPIDQPDISGIVPLSRTTFGPSTPNGQSTIRLQTENSTGMYMQTQRPHRPGVWTPRHQSEPPVRVVRPPTQSVIYMQPNEQQQMMSQQQMTSQQSHTQILLQQTAPGQSPRPVTPVQQGPQQTPLQQAPMQQIPAMWQSAPPSNWQSSQMETYHSTVQSSALSPSMTSSASDVTSVRRASTDRPMAQPSQGTPTRQTPTQSFPQTQYAPVFQPPQQQRGLAEQSFVVRQESLQQY